MYVFLYYATDILFVEGAGRSYLFLFYMLFCKSEFHLQLGML